MYRYPSTALRILLGAMLLVSIMLWLPVVRGATQSGYVWGLFGLGGRGLRGDYPILMAIAAVTWAVQFLGWRRSTAPWFHAGLIGWFGALAAVFLWVGWRYGNDLTVRGDTLGFEIPLGWVGAAAASLLFGLAVGWVPKDLRRGRGLNWVAPAWARHNSRRTLAAFALVPVQLAGFGFGVMHGTGNKLAVLATVAQAIIIGLALRPSRPVKTVRSGQFLIPASAAV